MTNIQNENVKTNKIVINENKAVELCEKALENFRWEVIALMDKYENGTISFDRFWEFDDSMTDSIKKQLLVFKKDLNFLCLS